MVGSQGDSSALLPTKALRTEAGNRGEQKHSPLRGKALHVPLSLSVPAAVTKYYRLDGFSTIAIYFSQCWRLKV